jgi:hypothetical protein
MMNRRARVFVLLGTLAVLTVAGGVLAASADGFGLGWHVVAGGGGASSSDDFALQGTAGQAAVGVLAGADYVLGSGFWGGGELMPARTLTYLPMVAR